MNTPRPADKKTRQSRNRRRSNADIVDGLQVYSDEQGEKEKQKK